MRLMSYQTALPRINRKSVRVSVVRYPQTPVLYAARRRTGTLSSLSLTFSRTVSLRLLIVPRPASLRAVDPGSAPSTILVLFVNRLSRALSRSTSIDGGAAGYCPRVRTLPSAGRITAIPKCQQGILRNSFVGGTRSDRQEPI